MNIETKNTIKVLNELKKYTDRHVIQKDINDIYNNVMYKHIKNNQDYNNLPAIAMVEDRKEEGIYIYLSNICPEISFVHEILHQILLYEGYPHTSINMNNIVLSMMSHIPIYTDKNVYMKQFMKELIPTLKYLESQLTSVIHHNEIYRRLENEYELDMNEERKKMYDQKIRRFNLINTCNISRKNEQYQFLRQQDIIDGLDYFLWKEEGFKLLNKLNSLYPDAYSTLIKLNQKCQKIGTKTPKQCEEIGNLIISEIILYGNRNHLKQEYNDLWRFLKIESNL